MIIASIFLRNGYTKIAEGTGTAMFSTMGQLYFFGALLSIILVGFIIILIAAILQIIAFFSLPNFPRPQPF